MKLADLSSFKYRWIALVFLSLSLAIVIIDNSVLNPAIPTILRDLNTSLDAIQWVISGYALIIAAIIITVGRVGDIFGRKRIFLIGTVLFAIGSFIASIAPNALTLFIGEAVIEAFGAAMMLTSTLSLLVGEFEGRERAIAFGVWGSVAGAAASLGPLLGGYLTTYHSWRWSLRINVIIALITIMGSVFIKESKSAVNARSRFDWLGVLLSAAGMFSLIFGFIEGNKYGWWTPKIDPSLQLGWSNHLTSISIIPLAFLAAAILLSWFMVWEYRLEKKGKSPLLKMSNFKIPSFSFGLATIGIISVGMFGAFLILPIYLQGVLGLSAFQTGVVFLATSISVFVAGPVSGWLASKIGPKWIVATGMVMMTSGIYLLIQTIGVTSTGRTLVPGLIEFGIGIGMTNAQLTNIILSAVSRDDAGEASASSNMFRQIGVSVGVAVMGAVLASTLSANISRNINADASIPAAVRPRIIQSLGAVSGESGQPTRPAGVPQAIADAIKLDVDQGLTDAVKSALWVGLIFSAIGTVFAVLIPAPKPASYSRPPEQTATEPI